MNEQQYKQAHLFSMKPRYTRETFYHCESNDKACVWVDQALPGSALILGPEGSGKTHLAHIWAKKHQAIFFKNQDLLKIQASCIVCDDAENMPSELLLSIYNILHEKKGNILLTMRQVPKYSLRDWESRLNALPRMRIFTPTQEHMRHLIQKILQDSYIVCPQKVLEYVVARIPYAYRALHIFIHLLMENLPETRSLTTLCARKVFQSMGVANV